MRIELIGGPSDGHYLEVPCPVAVTLEVVTFPGGPGLYVLSRNRGDEFVYVHQPLYSRFVRTEARKRAS